MIKLLKTTTFFALRVPVSAPLWRRGIMRDWKLRVMQKRHCSSGVTAERGDANAPMEPRLHVRLQRICDSELYRATNWYKQQSKDMLAQKKSPNENSEGVIRDYAEAANWCTVWQLNRETLFKLGYVAQERRGVIRDYAGRLKNHKDCTEQKT
jgi:hypothetical protein